ncbi:unnamed protein product [Cuscuta europaea]|uniref:Uncharacterized protein n=1 Tax=Cuscuta europaea TaxID=41803 RepID=A0A9P0Z220_CUSEU|nr:unnamed protein product [Cuscuta europaea]
MLLRQKGHFHPLPLISSANPPQSAARTLHLSSSIAKNKLKQGWFKRRGIKKEKVRKTWIIKVEARACCLQLCTGGKNLEEDVVRASFIILHHKLCSRILL